MCTYCYVAVVPRDQAEGARLVAAINSPGRGRRSVTGGSESLQALRRLLPQGLLLQTLGSLFIVFLGMVVEDVPGDGFCQIAAVARSFGLSTAVLAGQVGLYEPPFACFSLGFSTMETTLRDFFHGLHHAPGSEYRGFAARRRIRCLLRHVSDRLLHWGDQDTLYALATIINAPICVLSVYRGGLNRAMIWPVNQAGNDVVPPGFSDHDVPPNTIFIGHVSDSHYVAIMPPAL
jgi:hypothetical protein